MGHPKIILRKTPMLRKQAGQMWKLLGLWPNLKKTISDPIADKKASPQPFMKAGEPDFLNNSRGVNINHITRRQIVLNRHFTEIISDVLANNLKRELSDMGVSITSIETKAWNKGVRIFYSTLKPFDDSTHQELNSLITKLRYAISERQLIGRVPLVNFVYDKDAELNETLAAALKDADIKKEEPTSSVLNPPSSNIKISSRTNKTEDSFLNPKRFSAPSDMTNSVLGLDYPSLYNEAASKMERGRAQSARMVSDNALDSIGPFIKVPIYDDTNDEEDPTTRIVRMQKFMIAQRKKKEYLSRSRRQQELFQRDQFKWDVVEDEEEEEETKVNS